LQSFDELCRQGNLPAIGDLQHRHATEVHDQGRLIRYQGRHCLNEHRLARPALA
jgi:hypothetical protein